MIIKKSLTKLNSIILGVCYISLMAVTCALPPLVCLNVSLIFSIRYFYCVRLLAVGLVYILVPAKAVCTGIAKGFGAE